MARVRASVKVWVRQRSQWRLSRSSEGLTTHMATKHDKAGIEHLEMGRVPNLYIWDIPI